MALLASAAIVETALKALRVLRAMLYYRLKGVHFRGTPYIWGMLPRVVAAGTIRVGNRFKVNCLLYRAELGAKPGAELIFGDDVFLNSGATVYAATRITIGDHTRIGYLAAIYDSDIHEVEQGRPVRSEPIAIGRNVWIGRNAVVLPGVTVGDHAVIAAGAIVNRDVPARTLVAGNPAQTVRELRADDDWVRA